MSAKHPAYQGGEVDSTYMAEASRDENIAAVLENLKGQEAKLIEELAELDREHEKKTGLVRAKLARIHAGIQGLTGTNEAPKKAKSKRRHSSRGHTGEEVAALVKSLLKKEPELDAAGIKARVKAEAEKAGRSRAGMHLRLNKELMKLGKLEPVHTG